MNAHESAMDDHETLPVPAESRDVVPGDPVYDAELVDDPPAPTYVTPKLGRFTKWWLSWWLRSPRVPVWLKNRRHARQAARDLVPVWCGHRSGSWARWCAVWWRGAGGGVGG